MFEDLKRFIPKTANDSLVIHSDLSVYGTDLLKYKDKLIETLFSETSYKSVYIPTFSYYNKQAKSFSINDTPVKMGVLSKEAVEYVKNNRAFRIENPIHSYTGVGEIPKQFKNASKNRSFGESSAFDFFYNIDAIWCCLGCDISDGFTLFHHAEVISNVPYRKWIVLKRILQKNNEKSYLNYHYFDKKENIFFDYEKVVSGLTREGALTTFPFGRAKGFIGSSKTIIDYLVKNLANDPYFLVK